MTSSFQLRPFDGHAVTYTLREIHSPACEYVSQHPDADSAAGAYLRACDEAQTVELRDPAGSVIAAYARGRG